MEDIEQYGRRFKRQRDLNDRYVALPAKSKSCILAVAYTGTKSRTKVDGEAAVVAERGSREESEEKRGQQKKKNGDSKGDEAAAVSLPSKSAALHRQQQANNQRGQLVQQSRQQAIQQVQNGVPMRVAPMAWNGVRVGVPQ